MNYRMVAIIPVILLSGCAMSSKMDSIRKVADQKNFQGIDENTQFSVSFPSPHSGPYKSVDQFNFIIEEGEYKGKNASALLVQSQKTGEWEVKAVLVEENGSWINIPKTRKIQF